MRPKTMRPKLAVIVMLIAVLCIFAVLPVYAETQILTVQKFYDRDADGIWDDPDEPIVEEFLGNWLMSINGEKYCTPAGSDAINGINLPFEILTPITVSEYLPVQTNWRATTPTIRNIPSGLPIQVGPNNHVKFGNLCLGPGDGRTPGFWSNKNGQARMNLMPMATALSELSDLNLWVYNRDTMVASEFNPTTYAQFRTWLVNRNAIDMRYQLSAFVAAMKLNTMAGFVDGDALIYVSPGLGYMTIDDVLDAANTALGDGSPRSELTILKNALDRACNNQNFVQPDADECPYTFAEGTCPLPV